MRFVKGVPSSSVDRLIVHQFDPARPSPGGIDTCIRGICKYFPLDVNLAVVGVDTGSGPAGRKLGVWESHELSDGRTFAFLPAVRLDPANQTRLIPHSLRLMIAVLRFRRKIPKAEITQVHRMDNAFALRWILRSPQAYFIHTQENGLTGKTSDSIWRFLGSAHRTFERYVVRRAKSVVVFNETYSEVIRTWNPDAVFSPTWFDPELVSVMNEIRDAFKVVWIGRLETPKDPALAVDAFAALVAIDGQGPWSLEILGSGTMLDSLREKVSTLGPEVSDRISVLGRVSPKEVATRMAKAGIFLMTSHPGYEGYPRVLVESLASGLPAVVTEGSDTGGLVIEGVNGFVRTRSADDLAKSLMSARTLDRDEVRRAVSSHDAPTLVARIFRMGNNLEKVTS